LSGTQEGALKKGQSICDDGASLRKGESPYVEKKLLGKRMRVNRFSRSKRRRDEEKKQEQGIGELLRERGRTRNREKKRGKMKKVGGGVWREGFPPEGKRVNG